MPYLILVLALLVLAGCIVMPSRTEPWCLPHVKGSLKNERVWAGVRCAW